MVAESNPLFSQQWHLEEQIGDIQAVWADYTGQGINVGVYDDGVERTHDDLDGNYNGSLHASGDDGQPNTSSDAHGTAVAGLIAAENNNIGGVGVAFDANITGVDLLSDLTSEAASIAALRHMEEFDVTNNSWGYTPSYAAFLSIADSSSQASGEARGFAHAVENGRDGLGTVILKAAGNEANNSVLLSDGIVGNAQGEGLNSLHTVITVAATEEDGTVADYSNWGANLLIAAPAAEVTTDRSGSAGYSSGDYADDFGGTSAATPVTAGVAALMLEANADLGWRDVQNILATSASHTGSDYGSSSTGYEVGDWAANGASNWNGGGMSYHLSYGYGRVDAFAAVRMAEVWDRFYEDAAVNENEEVVTASFSGNLAVNDNTTTTVSINVTEGVMIEHIYVTLEGTHTYLGDLEVRLVSPDGDSFLLFDNELRGADLEEAWTFGIAAARGLTSQGEWRLEVQDSAGGDTGAITGVELEFRGSEVSTDTVHHFTQDFEDYADEDAGRRTLEDTDGGSDWMNLVAVTGNVALSLSAGGTLSVAGDEWASIASGTDIENAALGDGNDTVTGSSEHNTILGGRGDDSLRGEGGEDRVEGGAGNDRVYGNGSNDTLYGGDGDDRLSGSSGDDSLRGDAGEDTLYGGDGDDTLRGGDGDNYIAAGSGDDKAYGGTNDDSMTGAAGHDRMVGGGGSDTVLGGTGNDTLYGNAGDDTLNGEDGADWSSGGDGADLLLGRDGNDTMRGSNGDDRFYGGADNDVLAGNLGNDTLYGGSGNDRMFGGGGADYIVGGNGSDVMAGGDGADVFVFGSISESVHGSGRDVITDFTHNVDQIDLSGLGSGLTFVSSYSGSAGQVRYNDSIGRLYVDIDGDGTSDVSINVTGAPTLDAGDLIL